MLEIVPWDNNFSNQRILVLRRERFEVEENQWLAKDLQVVLFQLNDDKEELENKDKDQ